MPYLGTEVYLMGSGKLLRILEEETELLRFKRCIHLGMAVHTCNSSTWEAETGLLRVGSHPGLHSKFKARLNYIDPDSNNNKNNNKRCILSGSKARWAQRLQVEPH